MKTLVNEILDYAAKNYDVITRCDASYNYGTMLYSARVWFASGKVIDFGTSIDVIEGATRRE